MAPTTDQPVEHPLEVRAICDGLVLVDRTFTEDQEHTAEAYYTSTTDYFRRTDDHEVTVALLRGEEVVYETTIEHG